MPRCSSLYSPAVADETFAVVRALDPATGEQTVVAGNASKGREGDGGPATAAQLGGSSSGIGPQGIALTRALPPGRRAAALTQPGRRTSATHGPRAPRPQRSTPADALPQGGHRLRPPLAHAADDALERDVVPARENATARCPGVAGRAAWEGLAAGAPRRCRGGRSSTDVTADGRDDDDQNPTGNAGPDQAVGRAAWRLRPGS